MHELTVTKSIFDIVNRRALQNDVTKVITIHLDIGAFSDLGEEWMQKYFDRLSRDSVCAEAKLVINRIPAEFNCESCGQNFELNSLQKTDIKCHHCNGSEVSLVSGKEYYIKNMEAI